MRIDEHSSVAVIVKRSWANLHGVRMFLYENRHEEVRGVDESHILFAKVVDGEDAAGLWIEVHTDKDTEDRSLDPIKMLIPWSEVLTIVVAEQFSPAIRQEARRIGFTGETERD